MAQKTKRNHVQNEKCWKSVKQSAVDEKSQKNAVFITAYYYNKYSINTNRTAQCIKIHSHTSH